MMPVEWQHTFINNGQDIASNNYTLLKLQQCMGTQETLHHALTQNQHPQMNQSHNHNPQQECPPHHNHCHSEETQQGPPCQCFHSNQYHNGNQCTPCPNQPSYHHTSNYNTIHPSSTNHGQNPDCD